MNLQPLLPLIILAAASMAVLLALSIRRNHEVAVALALLGFAAAFVTVWMNRTAPTHPIGDLLVIDSFALFFFGLFCLAGFAIALLAYSYLRLRNEHREEFYSLLLIGTLGAVTLVSAGHFVTLFLGLEVLSVALYVMIAYLRDNPLSLEAGLKYIILAGASSAFLLFGMALIYAVTGSMNFSVLRSALTGLQSESIIVLAGLALMLPGIGFKLAVVPFHMWTPDVYEGAPAPVSAFIASISKGAVLGLLLRFFLTIDGARYSTAMLVIVLIAVASMIIGNLLALLQQNVKRLLAYSSISHVGYMLVAFVAAGDRGVEAVMLYLTVYFVTIIGAFGVVGLLSGDQNERVALEEYRGIFWQRPWPAAALTAALLSLAGIPLTAGFVGKFFILAAGVGDALWTLVVSLVVGSAIGIFYYTRFIAAMFSPPDSGPARTAYLMPISGRVVLTLLTLALFALGIYPGPVLVLIRAMISGIR